MEENLQSEHDEMFFPWQLIIEIASKSFIIGILKILK